MAEEFKLALFKEHFNITGNVHKRNNEVRSSKHCCSGKYMIIMYSGCVFVDLSIHHELHMRRIVLLSVTCLRCSTFDHIIS